MLVPSSLEFHYLSLVVVSTALFGLLHYFILKGRTVPILTWLIVFAVLGGGWFWVQSAVQKERERIQQMIEGYAHVFAQEMSYLGHQEITPATSPDNPRFWRMIAAQKRWQTANPLLSDIYTIRQLKDGHVALIVDSETDFDHSGRYEGDREQRTPIGQRYEGDLANGVKAALAGETVFQDRAKLDAFDNGLRVLVPLYSFKGDVEAVLGVDFDPTTMAAATRSAEWTTMGTLAALLLAIAAGSGMLAARRTAGTPAMPVRSAAPVLSQEEEEIRTKNANLEALVNSIDGIIWEADARTLAFTFVSQQCEEVLGYPRQDWLNTPDFRKAKLHPDDQRAYAHFVELVAAKEPYGHDFRLIAADGGTVWIRESAATVLDGSGNPVLVRGVFHDITVQKRAAEELELANARLVDSSRHAGMAEVATGVLHNVGNVLNSVNISGSVISERLRKSKVIELGKVAGLLTLQKADFAGFVARDPRGPHIPELISCVTEALRAEHLELLEEVDSITRNISHIKEIVSMQQGFAKGAGIIEPLNIENLVDDAIKINAVHLTRHRVNVVQAYEEVPKVLVDKHLVLQILVNLLRNAQQAIEVSTREERRIVVKIQSAGDEFISVTVQDSGNGIATENLTRIFSHGFTTKKTGHGFGLHSSALAATGMGGALTVHSDGPGTGATFSLSLPVYQPALAANAA